MAVKPIPDGFHSLTPYLVVPDGAKELEFLKKAFGAKESSVHRGDDGRVMHAELQLGDSKLMLGEPMPGNAALQAALYLYVKDTDAAYKQAVKAGAKSITEPTNYFYGDRGATVKDANGIMWFIGTHIEDVSEEEMQKRIAAFSKKPAAAKA